nr:MAG TPA: hypothetical protein [Caudoviricetes sp.]
MHDCPCKTLVFIRLYEDIKMFRYCCSVFHAISSFLLNRYYPFLFLH